MDMYGWREERARGREHMKVLYIHTCTGGKIQANKKKGVVEKQRVLDSFRSPQRQRQLQLTCSRLTTSLQSACCCSRLKPV